MECYRMWYISMRITFGVELLWSRGFEAERGASVKAPD